MIEERTSIVSIPRFAESAKDAERDARRSLRRTACAYAGPAFKRCRIVMRLLTHGGLSDAQQHIPFVFAQQQRPFAAAFFMAIDNF